MINVNIDTLINIINIENENLDKVLAKLDKLEEVYLNKAKEAIRVEAENKLKELNEKIKIISIFRS